MKKWHIFQNKFLATAGAFIVVTTAILIIISLAPNPNSSSFTNSAAISSNINSSSCPKMTETPITTTNLQFHPIKIVAEPWRGNHHVYAIFALPLEYKSIYDRSTMIVKGSKTNWYVTIANERQFNVTPPENSFLVIGFFRTRLALWYWLSGKFGDLQQPCNWTLNLFP